MNTPSSCILLHQSSCKEYLAQVFVYHIIIQECFLLREGPKFYYSPVTTIQVIAGDSMSFINQGLNKLEAI